MRSIAREKLLLSLLDYQIGGQKDGREKEYLFRKEDK
jgi:hypothetical protein